MAPPPRNNPFAKIPLRIVLIVPFVIQIVLAVGLVGYISFRNGQRAVNNVAHQLQSELINRIEERLRFFLATPHQINQINADAIRQGRPSADDPDALERYFWEQIQVFDSVTSVYFGNAEGGLVDAGREGAAGSLYVILTDEFTSGPFKKYATDSAGNRTELLVTVPDFDARTRSWYSNAVAKGDAAWSDVYILFTGQDMAISASRPVYDERQNLLGVTSVDIFASHLGDFMKNLEIGETGQSFIMERSGLLVASSTGEQPFTALDEDEAQRRLYARESAIPIIRHAAESLTERWGDYHNITEEQQFEFEIEGQRQFLQVAPVQDEYGIDWLVVIVIPESDFMAQINANNRATALLVGAALVIAIVVGVITAQCVIRPILHLNASTQALARGEWDQTTSVEWIGEIGELAQSFDQMVGQLKQTLESLTNEIAERKGAEQELRESEQRYRAVVEYQTDLLSRFRPDGTLTFVNNAYCRYFGKQRDELLGINIASFVPEGDREDLTDYLASFGPEKQVGRIEHQSVAAGGGIRWVQWIDRPILDERGAVIELQSVGRDITERVRAEQALQKQTEALRESEARYRSIVEHSHTGIVILDDAYRFTYVNDKFCHMLGYAQEELIGADFRTVLAEEDAQFVVERYVRGMRGEDVPARYEFAVVRKDGEKRLCETSFSVFESLAGDIVSVAQILDITERKRAEAEIVRLATVIEQAAVTVVITDLEGDIVYANPAFETISGYSVAEALGQNPRILKGDRQDGAFYQELWDAITAGRTWSGVFVNKRKDETLYHERATIFPIYNAVGEIVNYAAVKRDITEQVRAERAARERQRYLEGVLSAAPDAIVTLDPQNRIVDWNNGAERLFGYRRREVIGQDIDPLIAQGDILEEARTFTRIVSGGAMLFPTETVRYRRDGSPMNMILSGSPIVVNDEVIGLVAVYTDITERVQAEQELRRYAKRLDILREIDQAVLAARSPAEIAQAALNHVQDLMPGRWAGVVIFDKEANEITTLAILTPGESQFGPGTRVSMDDVSLGWLGQDEIRVFQDLADIPQPLSMVQMLSAEEIRSFLIAPLVAYGEIVGWMGLGSEFPDAFAPEHVEIAREVADQLAVAIRQASLHEQEQRHAVELTRALEKQRKLDCLKNQFVQNVSHELRTPLAIVRGYAELLDEGDLGELQPEQREPVAIIARRTRMLTNLIDDINAILEVETRELQWEMVDLAELFRPQLADFSASAEQGGLALEFQLAPDLPAVMGDPMQLQRVLDNLLGNALKFTPAGGRIAVRLAQEGTNVVLKVSDSGIGIPPDEREMIFERFYQVDGTASRRYGGAGLGLALVKEIVEAHGGTVSVEGELERGSTFTVTWRIGE